MTTRRSALGLLYFCGYTERQRLGRTWGNVMDMTRLDPLADSQAPAMATAFPEATTRIVEILRETGYPDLADPLPAQRFFGRCNCKPGCSFALTAPPGSSGNLMVWLEVSGETVGEASLDPVGQIITDFDIGDPKTVGIPPNWLEHGLTLLARAQETANLTEDRDSRGRRGP